MAAGVAVEGVATSFEFADDLVHTSAVGRCFVCLTSLIKEELVSGSLEEAMAVALGLQKDPEIVLILKTSFAALPF